MLLFTRNSPVASLGGLTNALAFEQSALVPGSLSYNFAAKSSAVFTNAAKSLTNR